MVSRIRRPDRLVPLISLILPGSDVQAVNGTLKDLERDEGLVEGDFMAGFVDTGEGERGSLAHLAVDDVVGCGDTSRFRSQLYFFG